MNIPLSFAAVLLVCFLIGGIPSGYIIGKCHHIDIREHGSKNIGATNVTRVIGKWWGKLCFLCDFLKGLLPVLLTMFLVRKGVLQDAGCALSSCAVFATVAGHIWPVYLKFKGGKGVATAAGAIMALSWPAVLASLIVWAAVFLISRYVSLASITAAIFLSAASVVLYIFKIGIGPELSLPAVILIVFLGILTVVKHRSNIQRLLNGTENRFSKAPPK